ncbi:putative sugar O-methyltransferase [Herbidospora yilanensis]|uniref:putative sugar O-methyltransferase n=1 Tax=Herbidospora yilanensis TaxID=354426 RepID=UPI00078545BE|nr:putative sugar O-methyltransferase [Herbidospora yilanensis]
MSDRETAPATHRYGQSPQWARINRTSLALDALDLATFKSSKVNYKISLWNPEANGLRYLKTLTYNLAADLSPENRARLARIRNRDVGAPITVTVDGDRVCLDYLQAVHELEFVSRSVKLDGARVLEIGAGYGRSCHAVLSNHDVAEYVIVDLENCLTLTRDYLRAVLTPAQFGRVRFLGIDEVDDLVGGPGFDLCLNIDSFAEMNEETARNYLTVIDTVATAFYTKNPVGKYLDYSLDRQYDGEEAVRLALGSGLLRDIVDVHDASAVREHAARFVSVYRPGPGWTLVEDGWARPWTFYWQALYTRTAS